MAAMAMQQGLSDPRLQAPDPAKQFPAVNAGFIGGFGHITAPPRPSNDFGPEPPLEMRPTPLRIGSGALAFLAAESGNMAVVGDEGKGKGNVRGGKGKGKGDGKGGKGFGKGDPERIGMPERSPGIAYLEEQVRRSGYSPPQLDWCNSWHPGEARGQNGPGEGTTWQTREEEERMWNSGWMGINATPGGIDYFPTMPPTLAKGKNFLDQEYYIPWVPPDPMSRYPEAMEPNLQWVSRKEVPYEPEPRIVDTGSEPFTRTRRLLKKITWYVPDGVDVGPPRLPVKVFGTPPPDSLPQPKREHTKVEGAVDLTGLEKLPEYQEMVSAERRYLLDNYAHQAKRDRETASNCARNFT